MSEPLWHLYILDCDGSALYTGISTDPQRRLLEHRQADPGAAKFTRRHRRLALVYSVPVGSRSLALKLEKRLKSLSRQRKQAIIEAGPSLPVLLKTLGLDENGSTAEQD